MSETEKEPKAPEPKPKRRWPRRLAKAFLALVALVIVAYFFFTSSFFLTTVVLPRVGKAMNADVSASKISLHPFSSVEVTSLSVKPGKEEKPLLTLARFRAEYSLWALIGKTLDVGEVSVDGLKVFVERKSNGTMSFASLIPEAKAKPAEAAPTKEGAAKAPSKVPVALRRIGKVEVKDLSVEFVDQSAKGEVRDARIEPLNFTLQSLEPGKAADYRLQISFSSHQGEALKLERGDLLTTGSLTLGSDLQKVSLVSSAALRNFKGQAGGQQLDGYSLFADLAADVDLAKQISLLPTRVIFQKDGATAGRVSLEGEFQPATQEGRFVVKVDQINTSLLSLLSPPGQPLDFGRTSISTQNVLQITRGGQRALSEGTVKINNLTVAAKGITAEPTPPLSLDLAYKLWVDPKTQSLGVDGFNFTLYEGGVQRGKGSLTAPFEFSLQQTAGAVKVPNAGLHAELKDFNLARWSQILAAKGPVQFQKGTFSLETDLGIEEGGTGLTLAGKTTLADLQIRQGEQSFPIVDLAAAYHLNARTDQTIQIRDTRAQLQLNKQPAGAASLAADVNLARGEGKLNASADKIELLALFPLLPPAIIKMLNDPELLRLRGGRVEGNLVLSFAQKGEKADAKADFKLVDARFDRAGRPLSPLDVNGSFNVSMKSKGDVEITKMEKTILLGGQPAGKASGDGRFNLTEGKGTLNLATERLRVGALASFAPMALPVELKEGYMDEKIQIQVSNHFNDIAVKGSVGLTRLAASMPPLQLQDAIASVSLDAGLTNRSALQLRDVQVQLGTGSRPGTPAAEASITGNLDLKTRAGKIALKVKRADQGLLAFLNDDLRGSLPIENFTVTVDESIETADELASIQGKGLVKISNLQLRQPDGGAGPKLAIEVEHDAALNKDLAEVRSFQVALGPQGSNLQTLRGSAKLYLKENPNWSTVEVKTSALDLTPLAAPFLQKPASASTSANKPTPPATNQPQKEPAPLDLRPLKVKGDISLGEIRYEVLVIRDFVSQFQLADNRLDISKVDFKVEGGNSHFEGSVKTDVPGFRYDFKGGITELPIEPFSKSLMKKKDIYAVGTVAANYSMNGAGITMPSLKKNLKGKVTFEARDGEIKGVPILDELANALKISELSTLKFFKGIGDIDIKDGTATLNQMDYVGSLEKLGLRGWVDFDQRIDLSIYLAAGPPLNKNLRELKYVGEKWTGPDGFTKIPVPIRMVNTLSKPRAQFDFQRLVDEEAKSLIQDALQGELKKRLEKEKEKIGEKKEGEKSDKDVKKELIDQGLDLLLNQINPTPTPKNP
ncbi:MAG: DUF748 domain-containing protein [bacterium]